MSNEKLNVVPDATRDAEHESARSLVGKIARLPKSIREELNRRLDDGKPASEILPWLNALPAVKKMLAAHFDDTPINHRNLSNWRLNGYQRWLEKQKELVELAGLVEDILVVASQAVDKPGLEKPTNWKEYLGNQLVAKLDDNNLTLPPDDYTRVDYRLVMKDRGRFVCEPNDQGMHGDCFDADKLAGHALAASSNRRTIVPPLHLWAAPPGPAKNPFG